MLFSDVECQTTSAVCSCNICSEVSNLDDVPSAGDDISVDFPSLSAAASFHEKKHDSCCASLARRFKQAARSHAFPADDPSYSESACCTSKTAECIPASNALFEYRHSELPVESSRMAVWTELRRKSSGSDSDVAVLPRQKVFADRELERPIIGSSSSGKALTSMAMVLGDFLKPNQVSEPVEEQQSEFVPMFVCTICGDRTHRSRDCTHHLHETFRD